MPNPATAGLPNPASYDISTTGVVVDKVTHLMWQHPVSRQTFTWTQAQSYCGGLSLAGHNDWRLPSEIELYSLIDFTAALGAGIDHSAFPGVLGTSFWSSTPTAQFPAAWGWYVDFAYGGALYDQSIKMYSVRCVRGEAAGPSGRAGAPAARYTVFNGTVRDNATGLTWQQTVAGTNSTFSQAQNACASLGLNGAGWRVPSIKELETLVDFSVPSGTFEPTIDVAAFPGAPPARFWSSTSLSGNPSYAWFVDFMDGGTYTTDLNNQYVMVRCVR